MLGGGHRQNLGEAQRGESLAALGVGWLPSGALQLDLKEDRERESGGEACADLCLRGLWTVNIDSS